MIGRLGGVRRRGWLMGSAVCVGLLVVSGVAAGSSVPAARPLSAPGRVPAPATRFGRKGGIVLSRMPQVFGRTSQRPIARGPLDPAGPQQDGLGSGNLTDHGGPVMRQNTVHAIYWIPSGYSVSANFESLIDGYFQNVADASGRSDNDYSVAAQYGDSTAPGAYRVSFGGSVVDSDPFPANGCTDGPLPVCLTDAQIQAEIDKMIAAHGWQAGLTNEFFIFTPEEVGSCFDSGSSTCAYSYYCAYHSSFTSSFGDGTVVYANEPYAALPAASGACDSGERPNGDAADAEINLVSHEQAESITNPLGNAWYDAAGYEIGDKCAWIFGQPLGSTGGSGTGTDYNEQIGSGKYYLQQEWSDQTFDPKSGEQGSCVQRDLPQLVLTGPGDGSVSGSSGVSCSGEVCDLSTQIGATVTLTAHPATAASFSGWQGQCSGSGTCTVTVTPATAVVARFETSHSPTGWAEEPLAPPAGVDPLPQGVDPAWSFYRVTDAESGDERATTVYTSDGACPVDSPLQSGGIYLQRQTDAGWVADGTITAPEVGTGDWSYWPSCNEFGAEISLSADGSTLLTSQDMVQEQSGFRCAAFLYERGSSGWSLAATLFPPGIGPSGSETWDGCDYFGINSTLSADGRRAVILSADRVEIYARSPSGWALEQQLVLPSGDNCYFTVGPPRIAISGNGSRLLVGAPDCAVSGADFAGQVYDYERSGSTWSLAQTIESPDPIYNDYFGAAVALSSDGDTAAIATQDESGFPAYTGAAWVYEHDQSGWQRRVRLMTPTPEAYDLLTCPFLNDDGSQIVCTAFDTVGFDPAQGSVYVFQRPGSTWSSAPTPLRLFAGDGHVQDNLGAGHVAVNWFMPASLAVPEGGGDVATTIAAQNVGLYGKDRIGYEFTRGPVVRSFSPSRARAGTQIVIGGANFADTTAVTFDGVAAASFTVDSSGRLTAVVPPTASVGTIGVTTPKGRGWSAGSFSPLPSLSSFSPAGAAGGARVLIEGANLSGASGVRFAGRPAQFVVRSPVSIVARIPKQARGGHVVVTTPTGRAVSSDRFRPLPSISSVTPRRSRPGGLVTITGSNLGGTHRVLIQACRAHFHVVSPTTVVAVVPRRAASGRVTVWTWSGSATSRKLRIRR